MSWIEAPKGMSYINAYHALEEAATKLQRSMVGDPNAFKKAQQCVLSCEKVDQLFQNYPLHRFPRFTMEGESGKTLNVYFYKFPKIFVGYYDDLYGKGAAQRTLQEYAKIPSRERFDANDTYQFSELVKNYDRRRQ